MSSRLMVMATVVAAMTVAGAGCGSTPTSPTPTPAVTPNVAPMITSMSVKQSSYRTGQIVASASDSDGQVASGTVDWGDGTTTTLTKGFGSISLTHLYNNAQSFQITLRVADDQGAAAQQTASVKITVPPEACVGIEIIDGCAQATSDFKHVTLSFKAGDVVLGKFTVNDGQSNVSLPLAGGFGKLNASVNFKTGRITLTGQVCPVPYLVCKSAGTTVIQL